MEEIITETEVIEYKVHEISLQHMEKVYIGKDILFWQRDSHYQLEEKDHFKFLKGALEIKAILGVMQDFDTETNLFKVKIYINGFYIEFITSKTSEADNLYAVLLAQRWQIRQA